MRAWLCIEPSGDGPRVSNLPGGPNHCYITGTFDASGKPNHYPDCGEYQLLLLTKGVYPAETVERIAKVLLPYGLGDLLTVAVLDALNSKDDE